MSKNSKDVVITSALRTPIGGYKGSLKNLSASKLGSIVIKEVIYKSKLNIHTIFEEFPSNIDLNGLEILKKIIKEMKKTNKYRHNHKSAVKSINNCCGCPR